MTSAGQLNCAPAPSSGPDDARSLIFPTGLIVLFLLIQAALLAIGAFPHASNPRRDPSAAWMLLAGGQMLVSSWLWPMSHLGGRPSARPTVQAAVEAAMLALAAGAAVLPALWWAQVETPQAAAPLLYSGGWLLVGGLSIGVSRRIGAASAWAIAALIALLNLLPLALGYLAEDFLSSAAADWYRWSPMSHAARLTSLGWPDDGLDRAATLLPVAFLLLVATVAIIHRPPPAEESAY
jgi:hypothetical protein